LLFPGECEINTIKHDAPASPEFLTNPPRSFSHIYFNCRYISLRSVQSCRQRFASAVHVTTQFVPSGSKQYPQQRRINTYNTGLQRTEHLLQ